MIQLSVIDSPIGALTIGAHAGRVCALFFGDCPEEVRKAAGAWYRDRRSQREDADRNTSGALAGAAAALGAYFDGDVHALDRVDVDLNGTPFQVRIWNALRGVRAGQTASYSDIARTVGAPSAVRAVGAANGANPVAIIVPCHRIIGANGSLTGYGGGLDRKRWLLAHERGGTFQRILNCEL